MLINKRLILAHFWLAFIVFGAALGARRLADVRAQPAECLAFQSGILLSLGHRARLGDGLCVSDPDRDGVWLRHHRIRAGKAAGRPALGVGGLFPGRRRRGGGDGPGFAGTGLGALHLLSADGRQSLLLHRRRDGRGRLMDLGRADVDQHDDLEAREPGQAGAAGDVRQCRGLLSLGLDRGRRRARDHLPDPAGGAGPDHPPSTPGWRACSFPGRCMRSSISG